MNAAVGPGGGEAAGALAVGRTAGGARSRLLGPALLAVWAVVSCFARLGAPPVYVANEAREGVYARSMLASGDFVLPSVSNHVENGETVPDKPPLFHWLAAGAAEARAALTGRPTAAAEVSAAFDEWTLRFPSALGGCVMVLAVAVLGAPLVGERAALLAATALLTSWQFSFQARYGRVDMVFATCLTVGMLLAGRAVLEGSRRALVGAGVACGLAVLAKGPLGIVLPAFALGAFAVVTNRDRGTQPAPVALPWKVALLALLAVAVPWYVAAFLHGGGAFLRSQLFAENLDQFAGGNGRMRLGYYWIPWLTDSVPWNLMAVAALPAALRRLRSGAGYCAVWWLTFLVLFELAAYKRRAYLLPALPASSLLAGCLLDRVLPHSAAAFRADLAALVRRSGIAATVALVVVVASALFASSAALGDLVGGRLTRLDGGLLAGGLAVALGGLVAVVHGWRARDPWLVFAAFCLLRAGIDVGVAPTAERAAGNAFSAKALAERVRREAGTLPITVVGLGNDESLRLLFYMPRLSQVAVVPEDQPPPQIFAPGLYVFTLEQWAKLLRRTPQSAPLWRMRATDELRFWRGRTAVVVVERIAGPAAPPQPGNRS